MSPLSTIGIGAARAARQLSHHVFGCFGTLQHSEAASGGEGDRCCYTSQRARRCARAPMHSTFLARALLQVDLSDASLLTAAASQKYGKRVFLLRFDGARVGC